MADAPQGFLISFIIALLSLLWNATTLGRLFSRTIDHPFIYYLYYASS